VVAGAGAAQAVLRLVDCSLVTPPRTGPDDRARYLVLETLRGYGLDRLAEAGETDAANAALARHAVAVAEQAAAGIATSARELTAARWLDAEDAILRYALSWVVDHDPGSARGWRSRWLTGGGCGAAWQSRSPCCRPPPRTRRGEPTAGPPRVTGSASSP
jgi:hypothetical protein